MRLMSDWAKYGAPKGGPQTDFTLRFDALARLIAFLLRRPLLERPFASPRHRKAGGRLFSGPGVGPIGLFRRAGSTFPTDV